MFKNSYGFLSIVALATMFLSDAYGMQQGNSERQETTVINTHGVQVLSQQQEPSVFSQALKLTSIDPASREKKITELFETKKVRYLNTQQIDQNRFQKAQEEERDKFLRVQEDERNKFLTDQEMLKTSLKEANVLELADEIDKLISLLENPSEFVSEFVSDDSFGKDEKKNIIIAYFDELVSNIIKDRKVSEEEIHKFLEEHYSKSLLTDYGINFIDLVYKVSDLCWSNY